MKTGIQIRLLLPTGNAKKIFTFRFNKEAYKPREINRKSERESDRE